MSARVDPNLLSEIKKYGTVSVEKCFNCGNCTAICPLSTNGETFPRRIIRYAQLGLKEPLLSSKELWMCYYCGECTQTCPKPGRPGRVHGRRPPLCHCQLRSAWFGETSLHISQLKHHPAWSCWLS